MSDRCTGRAQPRTTPLHGRYDHITTSARHITLAPPLSRWIHLVRKDDASLSVRQTCQTASRQQPSCPCSSSSSANDNHRVQDSHALLTKVLSRAKVPTCI